MRECYHSRCDGPEMEGVADLGFLAKVTEGVVWAVADLAEARCGPRGKLSVRTLFALTAARQDTPTHNTGTVRYRAIHKRYWVN